MNLPKITFRVNLIDYTDVYPQGPFSQIYETLYQRQQAAVCVEGVERILKHGDTFTLYGHAATRVKNLYIGKYPQILEIVDQTTPTITTDSLSFFGYSVNAQGTISEGDNVIEYGFVYSETDSPTIDDYKIVVGSNSFSGTFNVENLYLPEVEHDTTYYFKAYASTLEETFYGDALDDMAYICLIEGTKITLANGMQKAIEDIDYNDDLLVWNFDEGKFDYSKPVWIVKKFSMPKYNIIKFSDGSNLGTIAGPEGHAVFNNQKGKFTYLNTEDTPVGTVTFNQKTESIELVGSETVNEKITFHNIITSHHINLFANGILTSSKLNNLYHIKNMKFIKENREIRSLNEFQISDDMFYGLRLNEQPMSYPNLKEKVNRMIRNKI